MDNRNRGPVAAAKGLIEKMREIVNPSDPEFDNGKKTNYEHDWHGRPPSHPSTRQLRRARQQAEKAYDRRVDRAQTREAQRVVREWEQDNGMYHGGALAAFLADPANQYGIDQHGKRVEGIWGNNPPSPLHVSEWILTGATR